MIFYLSSVVDGMISKYPALKNKKKEMMRDTLEPRKQGYLSSCTLTKNYCLSNFDDVYALCRLTNSSSLILSSCLRITVIIITLITKDITNNRFTTSDGFNFYLMLHILLPLNLRYLVFFLLLFFLDWLFHPIYLRYLV